jgi:uncharacterized membrane protein HdeD (DUF308 family)
MINKLAKNWWLLLIAGFVYIALGFLVWQYPGETILFATVYIGIALLISGLSMSVLAIGERDGISNWGWYLATGLIDVLLGGVFIFNPIGSAITLMLLIGIWFMFRGIIEFVNSFDLKSKGVAYWWLNLIGGLAIAIFGFIIIGRPLAGSLAIVTLISLAFWIKGTIVVIMALGIKRLQHKLKEAASL